jgi:hypothetical protein
MRRNLILAAAILGSVLSFSSFLTAQVNSYWIGKFEHHDGYQEEETLVIKRQGDRVSAVYRELNTDQLWQYFSLKVEINGNTASFFYDKCLPRKGDKNYEEGVDPHPCSEDPYKSGDLMFKLVKTIGKNNKINVLTYAGKFQDINRNDNEFFYKSK